MAMPMQFEWDEAKARANEIKHHVSFVFAVGVFLDPGRNEFDASRSDDREERRKVVGIIEGDFYTVVFTVRGTKYRIISARRSNRREERDYGNRSIHS